jgi:large subunit ribosomal protein L21e
MPKRKRIRTRGKLQLSRYFQELKEGEKVAVVIEPSLEKGFPKRLQGRTGSVIERKGRSYVIKIRDQDKEKKFIIHPVHLRRIK